MNDNLRNRIQAEIDAVRGHIEVANDPATPPAQAKEQLRRAHAAQRQAALNKAQEFIVANEDWIIGEFANGDEVDPSAIHPQVIPVLNDRDKALFRYASLRWSIPVTAGYGRRSRFLVRDRQNEKLIGIIALRDPVIGLGPRDEAIGWTVEQRHARLYHCWDAHTLGAVEPYRQLLGGKLVALAALSNDVTNHLIRKYSGDKTVIRDEEKDPTPVLLTTTSALGRSSVYNRLTFQGQKMFHSVGFSPGFGSFQFSDELFAEMRDHVRSLADKTDDESLDQSNRFGEGANWRFRVIRTCLKLLDFPEDLLRHGIRREVFIAPLAANWQKVLCEKNKRIKRLNIDIDEVADWYRTRWAIDRAQRRPQFRHWRAENMRLSPQLNTAQLSLLNELARTDCRVDLGPYSITVGTGHIRTKGMTVDGTRTEGSAYTSRLSGPGLDLEIADTTWDDGSRDIQGVSHGMSVEPIKDVVGRLPMGLYRVEHLDNMTVMGLRRAAVRDAQRQVAVYKTSIAELDDLFGFDVAAALDSIGQAITGTRETLLKESGRWRGRLCTVFFDHDRVTPVLVWSLMRAISLLRDTNPECPEPQAPTLHGRAPDLPVTNGEPS